MVRELLRLTFRFGVGLCSLAVLCLPVAALQTDSATPEFATPEFATPEFATPEFANAKAEGQAPSALSATNSLTLAQLKRRAAKATGLQPVKMAFMHFPPYTYLEKGQPTGIFVTLAAAMLTDLGLEYQFTEMPAARLYRAMAVGEVHLWLGTPGAPIMDGKITSGPTNIGSLRLNLYGAQGHPPPALMALKDTSLIVIQGYVYGGKIKQLMRLQGVRLLTTLNHKTAFKMLRSGRATYVLDYHIPTLATLSQRQLDHLLVRPVASAPVLLNVSLKSPHPQLLVDMLENALQRAMPAHRKALFDSGYTTAFDLVDTSR